MALTKSNYGNAAPSGLPDPASYNFVLQHPDLAHNAPQQVMPLYDVTVRSHVVEFDGIAGRAQRRRHTMFVRKAIHKQALWRRGWIDVTDAWNARDGEVEPASDSDTPLTRVKAAMRGQDWMAPSDIVKAAGISNRNDWRKAKAELGDAIESDGKGPSTRYRLKA